jgi:dolichol-phosphate mannosyltransferase
VSIGDPVPRVAGDRPTERTLVIIPTFDERENLPLILQRLHRACPAVHVLIVDDNSPDGTGRLADDFAAADPDRIHVLHRTVKDGLGAAYLAGFAWGLSRQYTTLVEMDADGSHAPEQLRLLLEAVDAGADLAIGSRYVEGGDVKNWPWRRWALSWTANTYARLALGIGIHDITAGYRAYRHDVLEKIDLDHVDSKGYCFQIDLTWRTITNGFVVTEVPITFTERELGVSKMSGSNIREALVKVAQWGIDGRLHRKRSTATARLDQIEPLLEQFIELVDRAALQQHVPVRTGRLHLFRLGQVTLDQGAFHAVAAQPVAGDLGVVGERNVEFLAVLGAITRNLARRQVVVAVGLVTYGSKATAS